MTQTAAYPALDALNVALLPEQVADHIAEAIAEGRIAGGTRLVEAEVALALGVTRTPLREAFRILHSQGLLQITPRRGTRVIDFDEGWAEDVRNLRLGVEKVSCAHAALRLRRDPAVLERYDQAVDAIRAAVAQGDLLATNRADLALHSLLADLADSPLVSAIWQAIRRHVLILFSIDIFRVPDPPERIVRDHLELRRALLTEEGAALEAAVDAHVRWQRVAGAAVHPGGTR